MVLVLDDQLNGIEIAVDDTTFILPETGYIFNDDGVAFDFLSTSNNALIVRGTIASDNADAIRASRATQLDILIAHDGIVMGDEDGIELSKTTHSEITNNGKIIGRNNEGVAFDGRNNTLNNYGEIVAEEIGVETDGRNHRIFNHGQITASDDEAVNMDGNGNRLVNTGVLLSHTDAAVRLEGSANFVDNSGQVTAHTAAGVELVGDAGDHGRLFNSGTISGHDGQGNAIVGSAADETVINRGEINGNVALGGGNDVFNGLGGKVVGSVSGGSGDDIYIVDDSSLTLIENPGAGYDIVRAKSSFALGANFEELKLLGVGDFSGLGNDLDNIIRGNSGHNLLNGGGGNDTVYGGAGNDTIYGGSGDDTLVGGSGNDELFGGPGNDHLRGGRGDDSLIGGMGQDRLIGGPGADRFVYNSILETPLGGAGRDRIKNFSSAEGDRIDLSGIDADVNTAGDDGFTFIGTSAFSGSAGELRYVDIGGRLLVRGDVDGDGNADFEILVAGTNTLSAADFIL